MALGKKYHLCRSKTTFFLIAVKTADDHISAGTASAAGDRNDVVDGQLFFRKFFAAVTAYTASELLLKIRGLLQFARLGAFTLDVPLIADYFDVIFKHLFRIHSFHPEPCGWH